MDVMHCDTIGSDEHGGDVCKGGAGIVLTLGWTVRVCKYCSLCRELKTFL